MLNKYALWKNALILVVVLIGALYALPNIYGSNPAIQITATRAATVDENLINRVKTELTSSGAEFSNIKIDDDILVIRFENVENQLKVNDMLRESLGEAYSVAQNIITASPEWLLSLGAQPMYLGLDLRGGLHFLMEVDMDTVLKQAYETFTADVRRVLRQEKIRYLTVKQLKDGIEVKFRDSATRDKAEAPIRQQLDELTFEQNDRDGAFYLSLKMTEVSLVERKKSALKKNITTLRKRVNEYGVSEPVIQQQGEDRIVLQLPGVQCSSCVKKTLSAVASLEFRLVDWKNSIEDALKGRVPIGSRLYYDRQDQPYLLKKRVIMNGQHISSAASGMDSESASAAVYINTNGVGAKRLSNVTRKNIGKPMAVVFIEQKPVVREVDGKEVVTYKKTEEVINVATIQDVLSRRFQITGLDSPKEAHELALLIRAGALVAPIRIIEERTIGPSLGQDNIDKGTLSVIVGLIMVVIFMAVWYKGFGLVANVALSVNLILIIAILSLLQATLTLPGIAGIVLTVGMAVDANVLIFERVREELRNGNSPQMSIHAGYEKALSTIADANITTLIAAVVLFIFGTGAIKGFAITLSIGILTSMFTAIMGTRAIINLFVSGKTIKTLSV
ncbi:Protein translocase subunit SecD [hydrothermal vent metagenome]|uniref:Protein translocase subunit SecD n=1 Tax=hydrothermal vent metagenome TaxID=652676 RepID=A0A3B0ZIK7_9ZZZZ